MGGISKSLPRDRKTQVLRTSSCCLGLVRLVSNRKVQSRCLPPSFIQAGPRASMWQRSTGVMLGGETRIDCVGPSVILFSWGHHWRKDQERSVAIYATSSQFERNMWRKLIRVRVEVRNNKVTSSCVWTFTS